MNYVIPQTREEAVDIYQKTIAAYFADKDYMTRTKYDMFIGALCGCSDEEFAEHTNFNTIIDCCDCPYFNHEDYYCSNITCNESTNEIFSRRWNE
ncbi:hypothetical protein [Anaerosinus massiliensis]|uniref:hypothetical protein n=1 Tax=Massilibacillus massiliensis TaxID=1806837 RepID=UPI000DA637EF|nr:hypothetical protein [Massilibacillus massiliensis]